MFDRVYPSEILQQAASRLREGEELNLTGVWGASVALLAAALGVRKRAPVLLVVNHLDDADAAADDIEVFLKDVKDANGVAHNFPAWETQLATDHVSEEVTGERLRLLNLLADPEAADERVDFIVAPIMALLQPVPTPRALEEGRYRLTRGQTLSPDALLTWLTDSGYDHVEQVDQQGEFAHRGGIVDIFPPGAKTALRAEFFGDELESLRLFDLDSQRSLEEIQVYDITAMTVGRSMDRLIEDKLNSRSDAPATTNLFAYLPANTIICLSQPAEVRELAEQLYSRIRDDLADEASPVALRSVEEIFAGMERFTRITCHLFAGARGENSIQLGIRSLERLAVNTSEALIELEELAAENDVWVYCETPAERERFDEMLAKHHPRLRAKVQLADGHVSGGFYWPALRLVVVGHSEIYHRYAKVRRVRRVRAGRPIQSMLDLHEGDYVVHVGHGIAKFEGLRRMDRDGSSEEYLRLLFADGAVLHVPVSQINLVQKYIGTKHKRPTLSKLGGKHWARAKERVGEAVKDLAGELLRLQAVRRASPGVSYPAGTELQRQLADEFPYTETEDQTAAIAQIDTDMSQPRPMDRLICGDVGYGKTELAMRAAIKIVEAGKQVAVLVPTTVLADQHYRTFTERFADFPVSVDVISRFRTAGQQAEIINRLQLGQIDILIGTHRLLSKDVRFPDLGLVIIDEEQRFGVMHKEHMKQLRATLDVLTLTATPIPRTLHMALLGLRDISSLQTPPMDRRAIHTEVCDDSDELIRTAILRELNRNGQTFFVHNRVQDIDAVAKRVETLSGGARVEIAHGQMPERGLERVMMRFTRGQIDVLVCTTIIESGLDIPTANTMMIHEADRYGLAELHQLRGRVGRYKHRAYCYLLLPARRTVSPIASKRLKAIEDFSDLGAGFQIAMRDLEIRGAGNILGPQQSGHIALVGYELYCELLEQAVREMKGETPPPRVNVHIELGMDAYIPRSYIPSERQRMEIYRRLVLCCDTGELTQLRADLIDAFGPPPAEMEQLLDVAELRVRAATVGVESMMRMPPDIIFRVRDFKDHKALHRVFDGIAGTVRMVDQHTLHWRPPKTYLEMPTLLTVLLKRFRG